MSCTPLIIHSIGHNNKNLNVVAVFPIPKGLQNPTHDQYDKRVQRIDRVIKEARYWEAIPNRREPLTGEIVKYIQDKGKQLNIVGLKGNLHTAMAN